MFPGNKFRLLCTHLKPVILLQSSVIKCFQMHITAPNSSKDQNNNLSISSLDFFMTTEATDAVIYFSSHPHPFQHYIVHNPWELSISTDECSDSMLCYDYNKMHIRKLCISKSKSHSSLPRIYHIIIWLKIRKVRLWPIINFLIQYWCIPSFFFWNSFAFLTWS